MFSGKLYLPCVICSIDCHSSDDEANKRWLLILSTSFVVCCGSCSKCCAVLSSIGTFYPIKIKLCCIRINDDSCSKLVIIISLCKSIDKNVVTVFVYMYMHIYTSTTL